MGERGTQGGERVSYIMLSSESVCFSRSGIDSAMGWSLFARLLGVG